MDPVTPIHAFVRKFEATFGDRALAVAQTQRNEATDETIKAAWGHIVDLLLKDDDAGQGA